MRADISSSSYIFWLFLSPMEELVLVSHVPVRIPSAFCFSPSCKEKINALTWQQTFKFISLAKQDKFICWWKNTVCIQIQKGSPAVDSFPLSVLLILLLLHPCFPGCWWAPQCACGLGLGKRPQLRTLIQLQGDDGWKFCAMPLCPGFEVWD